jgi:hypothetical protein
MINSDICVFMPLHTKLVFLVRTKLNYNNILVHKHTHTHTYRIIQEEILIFFSAYNSQT